MPRRSNIAQLFSLRDLRNAVLGLIVVFGGIGLAGLTLYAHRTDQPRLAGVAAAVSLVFVLLILIFIVPPLARNASKEASQLNLPFEFTLGGAIMLGLILIVGFSAWNTGNNLLFLVLSFLAASMIAGFFAGAAMLKKLDVKMRFPETIFAGEPTPILVSLHNRKRTLPSYSVVAEVRGTERAESIAAAEIRKILPRFIAERLAKAPVVRRTLDYFVYVPRRQRTENRSMHVFPERGRFLIKDFEISTKFPFAFFRHRRRLSAKETELVVFPRLDAVEGDLADIVAEAGKLVSFKRGAGQDLLALRDYRPNDDLRRVDWKATARSRQLIVREFAAEDDRRITVFIDTRIPHDHVRLTLREMIAAEQAGSDPTRSERFEAMLSRAAAFISELSDEQAEIKLVCSGESGEFGVGVRHLHEMLKRLALLEPFRTESPVCAYTFEELSGSEDDDERSAFVVFTAYPDADLPEELTDRAKIVGF